MLQRARALVPMAAGSAGVVGGTFHSVAHRFLRLHAAPLGLPRASACSTPATPPTCSTSSARSTATPSRANASRRKHAARHLLAHGQRPAAALERASPSTFPWCEDHARRDGGAVQPYAARKRALGVLDLDDLLLYWRALALPTRSPAPCSRAFDHVLIDEYQDVNGLQVDIVARCAREPRTHRGRRRPAGDLRLARGVRRAHPGFPTPFPTRRSSRWSATTAPPSRSSTWPTRSPRRRRRAFPKQLRSVRGRRRPGQLVFCRDEAAQAAAVCDRVLAARERGVELREQAVLMRTVAPPTCSSSSSRAGASRTSSTAACATSRPRT